MIPIRRVMSMLIVSSMMIGIVPSKPVQSTAPKLQSTADQATLNDILLDADDYQVLISGQPSNLATISPKTDQDIFYIDAEAQQEITVEMQRSADEELLNGELSLFDPEDNLIANDDNSGFDGNPLIGSAIAETTGRYAVWVRDHAGTRTGSYRITATVSEPLVSAAEHSSLDLETDPCPEPAASLDLPALEPMPNQPQNARVTHTNQALPRPNYPLNCEFARDREILATLSPETFSLEHASQSFTTESVAVPESTQMLIFEYLVGRKTADSITPLHVEVLSGVDFNIVTNISHNRIKSQYRLGWQTGLLNIQAFRGQTIKLRFINDWWWVDQPSAQVRNLHLTQEIPDWELSNIGEFAIHHDDLIGAHAVITGANASLTSAPIDITNQTQSLVFRYRTGRWLNDGHAPVFVEVLSGANFATATRIDQWTVGGRLTDGWREAMLDLQAFRGQTIKIKIINDWWPHEPQVTSLDSFTLNWAVPGWDVSNASFVRTNSAHVPSTNDITLLNADFEQDLVAFDVLENADFEQSNLLLAELEQAPIGLAGLNATATSAEFAVPTAATSIHFEYLVGDLDNPNLNQLLAIAILSGENFEIREFPRGHEFFSSSQAGWLQGRIDLVGYRGKTIKLQFINPTWGNPTSQIKHLKLIQDVPNWETSNHQLIKVDTNPAQGNHLYLHGHTTQLTSLEFTVPLTAQQVRFAYQSGFITDDAARQRVAISILSGESFHISTALPYHYLFSATNQGWQSLAIDLQRFQGQVIKLRFQLETHPMAYLRLDSFQIAQVVEGWSSSEHAPISLVAGSSNGQSIQFAGNNATFTSDAWTVLSDTQALQFSYKTQHPEAWWQSVIEVNVLSGNNFEIITPIGWVHGSGNDPDNGWHEANLNLAQFQNQLIKLQFKHQGHGYSTSWIDNLELIVGPTSSNQGSQAAPDNAFIELSRSGQHVTSSSFDLASDSQFLRFEYQIGSKDHGNAQHHLAVEVLSGANFTTITRIDQHQLRYSLNDGWKIAQLPVQQFQNQTIKIRFIAPDWVSDPIVRIDKVALLSPRATLTNPIAANGTAYLNVPLTELGGPTTTAMMTITSLVVYDEYLDMSGFISYENINFPFEFSGDIYYSVIGDIKDKVLVLQDKLHNFKVINVAARSKSVPAVMTDRFTNNPNMVITLQEHYKYQYTTFTINNNIISDILEVKAKYGPAYTDDYWHTKIFNPISQSFEEEDASTHYNSPNQEKFHWYSWVDENETCTIIQQIDFKTYIRGSNNIGGGQGIFFATIKITHQRTNGEVRPHMRDTWPATACDGADSEISGLGLGSDDVSLGNDYILGSDTSDQGDVFQEVEYAAMEARVLPFYDQEEISIGLRLGSSFGWKPLAIAAALPLGDFGSRTSSSKIGAFPITEIPPPYTLRTNLSISTLYLADIDTTAHTEATVACFTKKVNNKSYIKINFIIPISHSRSYHRFPERVIYPFYYIDYLSGPC
ncbi:MAG: hypothetical protein LCH85_23950 [Chloroflexi bacterium]|nr:hypothetical protein [Chloroflexota bacterium]